MSLDQKPNSSSSNFSFFQYCSSILIHNTLIFELEKLQKQRHDIYYEFSFHRYLYYMAEIISINTTKVTAEEVAAYYLGRKLKLPKDLAIKATQWNKITVEYAFSNNDKQILLGQFPQISKSDILKAASSEIEPKFIKLLDGIYTPRDLSKNTYFQSPSPVQIPPENLNQNTNPAANNASNYIERMFEFTNLRVVFQFVYTFIFNSLSKLAQKSINIDYSFDNLVLLREGLNLKFIYLPMFTGFAEQLQANYLQDKVAFNYETFRKQYYLDKEGKLNQFLRDKNLAFIQDFLNVFLSDEEKKDIEKDSFILRDTLAGTKSLEEVIYSQDLRKRFTKELVRNNQILYLLINNTDINAEFKRVYVLEGKLILKQINDKNRRSKDLVTQQQYAPNGELDYENIKADNGNDQELLESLTESQILDEFLQNCLAITKTNLSNSQNSFVFTCEEFVDKTKPSSSSGSAQQHPQAASSSQQGQQSSDTSSNNPSNSNISKTDKHSATSVSNSSSKQPQQNLQTTVADKSISDASENRVETVKSLFDSKRKLLIELRIIEVLPVILPSQSILGQSNAEQTQYQQQIQHSLTQQHAHQQNNWKSAPNLKAADKKLVIDFSESDNRLTIKFLLHPSDVSVNSDNIDSVVYVFSILNLELSQFSIYFDEFRQVIIEGQVFTGGNDERVLLQMIYMIDTLVSYGLIFCEFFNNHILIAKTARDSQKFVLLVNEISEMISEYNFKYQRFISENNLDK